jgi:hypothetical protein
MQSYTQLKRLCIQPPVLTGEGLFGTPNHIIPRLKDTLPESLQDLWLYGFVLIDSNPKMEIQIQDVITGNSHPLLKLFTLEDGKLTPVALENMHIHNPLIQPTIDFQIQDNCGRRFVEPNCPIPQAGGCLGSWGDMYDMRVDGNRRFFNFMRKISPLDSDEESNTGPRLPYSSTIHVLPFTDHSGDMTRPGYMVFNNYTEIPLPPLFHFVIYFTHKDTLQSTIDLKRLYRKITAPRDASRSRLDIYFIPGANEMDCLSHYQGEQIARGSYTAQIHTFWDYNCRSELELLSPPQPGRLPGMLTKYPECHYQGLLFICTEQDWCDRQQSLWCVEFNSPDLLKEGGNDMGNKEEGTDEDQVAAKQKKSDESLTVSAITRKLLPINLNHMECESVALKWLAEVRNFTDEAHHVWKKASSQGWTNW